MPRKTPEEKAALLKQIKESDPEIKQLRAHQAAKNRKWADEIAMLERRVKDEAEFVDLGHGDTLAIRTCLSDIESGRLGELYQSWFTPLKDPDKNAIAKRKKIAFEIIELVTANPMITQEWLEENRDKFATDDVVNAIFSWAELRQKRENKRAQRLVSAVLFRPEQTGPELRGVPALHEDSGPEGMGGSP